MISSVAEAPIQAQGAGPFSTLMKVLNRYKWFERRGVMPCCVMAFSLAATGCVGVSGVGVDPPPPNQTLTLSTNLVVASQDGTPIQLIATLQGNLLGVNFSVSGMPKGTSVHIAHAFEDTSSVLTIMSSPVTPAGIYSATVTATAGRVTASQDFTLIVAIAAVVGTSVDMNAGVNGRLQQFMSTDFQPKNTDYTFFQQHPDTAPLEALGPQHIRVQVIGDAVPWKANSLAQQSTDWDFTILTAALQPILGVTDHSPEFQIASAPSFLNDSNGHFILNAQNLAVFAQYCANLVRYYNKGGFNWAGIAFVSPGYPQYHIEWWGILNEYIINGLTPSDYVQIYNAVVPAMLAVDPTIKFSALEAYDYDYQTTDPRNNLPTIFAPANQGGIGAQVDSVSTHFYSSCDWKDTDAQILSTVPGFANDVRYFRQEIQARPDLATVPVWVTENNVNAGYTDSNGFSTCNPTTSFVLDPRGSSPFFAGYRPYVFSQLGKADSQALFHWTYSGDSQFGEVDFNTGNKFLGYWVDYWLGRIFPATPSSPGPEILDLSLTEDATVEVLATKNADGSTVVMIANHAVRSPDDHNGTGAARTVFVDVSALGPFGSATQMTIDAGTNTSNGPSFVPLLPAGKIPLMFQGYGVTFVVFKL
jgi:hypothetical protein